MNSFTNISYFCLLSGENPELALYELESISLVFAEKLKIKRESDPRIVSIAFERDLESTDNLKLVRKIINRSTLVHWCCQKVFQRETVNFTLDWLNTVKAEFEPKFFSGINEASSFCVSTKRIGERQATLNYADITQDLNHFFGAKIQQIFPSKQVDLKHPKEVFKAIISRNGLWFGLHIADSPRKAVRKRTARDRPFFHPSSMNPILQRTLINLTAIKEGEWLLDPFCGTGGSLIEAALLGFKSVGIEIDRRIIWGASRNLKSDLSSFPLTYLIMGDAKHLGFNRRVFSGVVTDPPYGTAASTKGFNLPDLLLQFCNEIKPLLRHKSRLVVVVPSNLNIEEKMARILNASYTQFLQYVHRSLTRKILVFELSD
jgi:tRNA (guanine10-N2)-dimethyltransferase